MGSFIRIAHDIDIEEEELLVKLIYAVGEETVLAELNLIKVMQNAMYWMPYEFLTFLNQFKEYMRSIEDEDLDKLLLVLVELKETRREERGS